MKKVLFFLITFSLIYTFVIKTKKDFSFSLVSSPLPCCAAWQCAAPESIEEIDRALTQKFHYLGSGAQMIAFIGEDQKTVLKLFKMNHLLPKKWLGFVPVSSSYRHRKTTLREEKLDRTFKSVKIAYERVPDETGVIFAQLNKGFEKQVVVFDKQKKAHCINLASAPFVLQKRAELIYTHLRKHLEKGDREAFQEDREKILELVARRCRKGVVDSDSGVSANYGFIGEEAVQIDIGELSKQEMSSAEISQAVQRIQNKIDAGTVK